MISISEKIKKRIGIKSRGTLLFPEDFRKIGFSEAVCLALHRLEKEGYVTRVAQGIYVRPKESTFIGQLLPTAEEVADAISKRDRIKIGPTGIYALNALGLSTQVPMKLVLLTDGAPREIKVGKRTIKLKRTTPKNLLAQGAVSSLAIQALRAIGKDKVGPKAEEKIISLLKQEPMKILEHDIALAPMWIQKIMSKALPDVID